MSDDPQRIRQVLRDHGHEVPAKGKLSAANLAAYDQIMAGEADGDYRDGTSPEDFLAGDEPTDEQIRQAQEERKPQRPTKAKGKAAGDAARRASGWWQKSRQGKGRAKRPKHPRVPVTDLVAKAWEFLGDLSEPISLPASRTFKLQAPVAGLVLEDAVRDTMVDRVLQYPARWQGRGKVLAAMAAPVLVLEIERAQGIQNPQVRALRTATLMRMLEESMMLWQEVAGDKFEEAAERMASRQRDRAEVRKLIAEVIFAPAEAQPSAEDQAAARAQQFAGAAAA